VPSSGLGHGRKRGEAMSDIATLAHVRRNPHEIHDNTGFLAAAKDRLSPGCKRHDLH
jgi:sirohydrochlorin ferrochelatase